MNETECPADPELVQLPVRRMGDQARRSDGLPAGDDAREIPITFREIVSGTESPTVPPQSVACTMDAKQCPDGSFVGRVPPSCAFAPCGAYTE